LTAEQILLYPIEKNKTDKKVEIIGFKCDVSLSTEVSSIVKPPIKRFKDIDVLVNDTWILLYPEFIYNPIEEWVKVIQMTFT
jgi:NAD(P)-dependent dehydrogenase (short-subunit alcohol dehydrogenase family)